MSDMVEVRMKLTFVESEKMHPLGPSWNTDQGV